MIEHAELKISAVRFIDLQRIEIYWSADAEGRGDPRAFTVELDGVGQPLCSNDDPEAWDTRCLYEKPKRRTTLSLQNPIQLSDLGKVTLSVVGSSHSYPIKKLDLFYTRFTRTSSGILIKSSARVDYTVHGKACEMIEIMLSKRPEIGEKMAECQAALAIYGLQEDAYDIPEHRGGADFLQYPVEGFGGTPTIPVTSVSEKNVMRYVEGPSQTKYKNESIVAHEFGHAVHLIGINNLEDQTLAKQLVAAYEHAVANKLWPGTYAISNYEEYFATLTAIWFNVMAESSDGSWDGVRGPVNTRDEFKVYDPVGYAFFESIYPACSFPEPWNSTPNDFPVPMA
ncbi:hypothetical protein J7E73_12690 [Paenibacillus albidus]|uniref:hypothetical protein n=1 Tax=Paenibacillus albidus TaxID=2041023 RepID=UPI001BE5F6E7|nr:hypothetical protein [Paenibacillus albidus]MBT2289986.1 hypothetical protein [Paenibacillus albidus]